MRLAFMGTPELAAVQLEALLDSRHEVVCVVSQPDRRAGRGNKLRPPPVAALARARGIPLAQPETVKTRAFREWLGGYEPELTVVAAFGHILGPKLLAVPRLGSINVHMSLLPRWRGASPIRSAILAGDAETGIAIMQMDEGLDTGDVLAMRALPIEATDDGQSLHDRLAELGAELLLEVVDGLEAQTITAVPQAAEGVTYARRLVKEDGDLSWRDSAEELSRRIRGLHPWPGTRVRHPDGTGGARLLKLHPPVEVLAERSDAPPGTVVAAGPEGVDVACGDGSVLRLHRLQAPGRSALEAGPFLAGYPLAPGDRLASTDPGAERA